jgi:hypothetical protein
VQISGTRPEHLALIREDHVVARRPTEGMITDD